MKLWKEELNKIIVNMKQYLIIRYQLFWNKSDEITMIIEQVTLFQDETILRGIYSNVLCLHFFLHSLIEKIIIIATLTTTSVQSIHAIQWENRTDSIINMFGWPRTITRNPSRPRIIGGLQKTIKAEKNDRPSRHWTHIVSHSLKTESDWCWSPN